MGMEKFSNSLPVYTEKIENPELRGSLQSLMTNVGHDLPILEWDEGRIAVPIDITVDLPSLGNYEGIDIRETEPVIFVFDVLDYPLTAPRIFTDRLDFPKTSLAHLYIAVKGKPPGFCYVRENSDEWYANKRIQDLVIRISNWLRDAAVGELSEDGNQFEPLRLEGYSGTIIYDYNALTAMIIGGKSLHFKEHFSIALFERITQKDTYAYKFIKPLTAANAFSMAKEVDAELKKNKEDTTKKKHHFAYLIWGDLSSSKKEYNVNLPKSWEEFKDFCNFYSIRYDHLEEVIATNDLNTFRHFPVIVAITRPKTIIGYNSNIEFINLRFWVDSDDVANGKIINNVRIELIQHNQPLTAQQANKISDFELENSIRLAVFGCGALGSKIVMHLVRAGITKLTLIDPDHVSPHNLVRHALFGEDEGQNKAIALTEKIKKIYPHQDTGVFGITNIKAGALDTDDFHKIHSWILDFTASEAFFNKLSTMKATGNSRVASASLTDFGDLGILYVEGEQRNPRIDDLQIYLYSEAFKNEQIKRWLQREQSARKNSNITIRVGVGCNSETTILSDDKISTHAAYCTAVLKKQLKAPAKSGAIFLSRILDAEEYKIETESRWVPPFVVLKASNDPNWEIRIKSGITEKLEQEFSDAGKRETGGIFIGVCNYKTRTIHVTDLVCAPSDSKAGSTTFIRGYEGLSDELDKIQDITGGQIGYIGEWHTHPEGPDLLSLQDMESVKKHKAEFEKLNPPLPVFVSIVTPTGIHPFVF